MTDSNHDPSLSESASAELDGVATPDERELLAASPDGAAELDTMRDVRALLQWSNESPPVSVRETHLAAALDAWDRMAPAEQRGDVTPPVGVDSAAGAAITTPQRSTSARRRRRTERTHPARWLLGAAAAGVIVIGGVSVLRNLEAGSDDAAGDAADDLTADTTSAGQSAEVAARAADEFAGDATAAESADVPLAAPSADLATDAAADASLPVVEASVDDSFALLAGPSDLADFGATATYFEPAPNASTIAPSLIDYDDLGFPGCDGTSVVSRFDLVAGVAFYLDQPVVIGVDLVSPGDRSAGGTAIAVGIDCRELARARLPSRADFDAEN